MDKLNGLSVFVADDSKPSKMLTVMMLERLGCSVISADDGIDALTITRQQAFDLIFLDEKMPGLLGSDVAMQLCADKSINAQTPKIALTGLIDKEAVAMLYKKGMTHYLQKPITKKMLAVFLQQWHDVSSF